MRGLIAIAISFIAIFNTLAAQSKPFFIDLKNRYHGEGYFQTVSFCSNLNVEEIIYVNNFVLHDYSDLLIDYGSSLIHAWKDGSTIKEILLDDGDLRSIRSFGIKINDSFVILSYMHSVDSFILKIRNYDSELRLVADESHPITKFNSKRMYSFIEPDMLFCKDDEGNTYITMNTYLDDRAVQCIRLGSAGEVQKVKFMNSKFGHIISDGLFYDSDLKTINYVAEDVIKNVFDRDFEFIRSINLKKDNPELGEEDTTSGWATNFVKIDGQLMRFGKTNFIHNNWTTNEYTSNRGRVLSYADRNGSMKSPIAYTPLVISEVSEGVPRMSGGLFYLDGYIYTYFEYSSTGVPFYTGNTTMITKWDKDLNIVDETIFVFDPHYRLFTYWAELTEDAGFVGSGFYYNVAPGKQDPFTDSGAFVWGLGPNGAQPTLSAHSPFIQAVFVVKGNPTIRDFVIETDKNRSINYEVRVIDVQGRLVKISTQWAQGRMMIDMGNEKSGTYFYQILEGGKPVTGGKFVKM